MAYYNLDTQVGDAIIKIANQLENINKNLEKIANNTEKQEIKQSSSMFDVINGVGEFYGPIKKELNLDTIICNKNKESHVDKNIILD